MQRVPECMSYNEGATDSTDKYEDTVKRACMQPGQTGNIQHPDDLAQKLVYSLHWLIWMPEKQADTILQLEGWMNRHCLSVLV